MFFSSRVKILEWTNRPSFKFNGADYLYFFHRHNTGWPPHRCTERVVELAIADHWLDCIGPDPVVEIGAVSPYYWPCRIDRIIDPADAHSKVSDRVSLFDTQLDKLNVLSISTIEHIGLDDYQWQSAHQPLAENGGRGNAIQAVQKFAAEADRFLITVPVGYNGHLDDWLFGTHSPATGINRYFFLRDGIWSWRQTQKVSEARKPYGQPDWANAIVVLERGNIFEIK